MTKDEVMESFYNYCCRNKYTKVKQLCEEYPHDIDFMDEDGSAFAICFSYGYADLLNVLLNFYIETKLQGDKASQSYKVAYHNLQYMLESALDRTEPSEEIHSIIDKYIADAKDTESDVTSVDRDSLIVYNHEDQIDEPRNSSTSSDDSHILAITAENLHKWNNEQHSNDSTLIGVTIDTSHDG